MGADKSAKHTSYVPVGKKISFCNKPAENTATLKMDKRI